MFEIRTELFLCDFLFYPASSVDVSLDVIQIYFDTATYDEIEKDVKVISQTIKFYQFPRFPWHPNKESFRNPCISALFR